MSVLIKGMEMPTRCGECPCFYPEYNECNAIVGRLVDGKGTPPADCPLILVPPHGRLVDADKMIWKLTPDEEFYPTEADRLDYDSGKLMVRDIRGFIRDQPTIIPADGGE